MHLRTNLNTLVCLYLSFLLLIPESTEKSAVL